MIVSARAIDQRCLSDGRSNWRWYGARWAVCGGRGIVRRVRRQGRRVTGRLKIGRTQLQDAVPMSRGASSAPGDRPWPKARAGSPMRGGMLCGAQLGSNEPSGTGIAQRVPGYPRSRWIRHLRLISGTAGEGHRPFVKPPRIPARFSPISIRVLQHAFRIKIIQNRQTLRLLGSGPQAGFRSELRFADKAEAGSAPMRKVNPGHPGDGQPGRIHRK